MDVVDSQQVLRQQLGFARIHQQRFSEEKRLPTQRAALQACLSSLNLGLIVYFRTVFGFSSLYTIGEIEKFSETGHGDYRREEIISLLQNGQSWLQKLSQLFDSMQYLPKQWQFQHKRSTDLIASTAKSSTVHWTELRYPELDTFIQHCEELLDRHSTFDQEC